jgi:hypothetical protein
LQRHLSGAELQFVAARHATYYKMTLSFFFRAQHVKEVANLLRQKRKKEKKMKKDKKKEEKRKKKVDH